MKKKKAAAWFIVIVMVLSVFGIVGTFFSEEDSAESKVEYNGFALYNRTSVWQVQSGGKWYAFRYFPSELENQFLPDEIAAKLLSSSKVYLGFIPEDKISVENELNMVGLTLYNLNIIPQKACVVEEGCPDIPLIDCGSNAGIIFKYGEISRNVVDEQCLILEAPDAEELRKQTERLIYELLGVIRNGG